MPGPSTRVDGGAQAIILRSIQLLFAIVVLGCSAFDVYYFTYFANCIALATVRSEPPHLP